LYFLTDNYFTKRLTRWATSFVFKLISFKVQLKEAIFILASIFWSQTVYIY